MKLDEQAIRALSLVSDPIGVISLYVGVPVERSQAKPSWPIEIKRSLLELVSEVRRTASSDVRDRVEARIEAITPDVEELVDPKASGRGRALFVPVSGEGIETVMIHRPLPTHAVFDRGPCVRPLVEALDEARSAAVVTVQKKGVSLFEWRVLDSTELLARPFELANEGWRGQRGPSSANPRSEEGVAPDERYQKRVDANRERFLEKVADEASRLVHEHGFEEVVVFGDARLTRGFSALLTQPHDGIEVIVDDRVLDDSTPEALHEHATRLIQETRRQKELALVERTLDLARSGARAAAGLELVLDALNQGRVDRLYVDTSRSFRGALGPDASLLSPRAIAELSPEGAPLVEIDLGEAIVKRALATHARITPVQGAAREALGDHQGIAAVLRW